MIICGKHDKEKAIREIMILVEKIPHVFSSPDLDEWRHLHVPMGQLKCLFLIINRQDVNSHTLAQDLGVTAGNVTGIVDRLVEQDLVIRRPDPQDRRVIWLEASVKGKELLGKLMETHSKQIALILDYMKAEELKALAVGLKGLVNAVESHLSELKNLDKKTDGDLPKI
jgi:DNA-binding MarR family transcriptional regulator